MRISRTLHKHDVLVAAALCVLLGLAALLAFPAAAPSAPLPTSFAGTIADGRTAAQNLLETTGAPSMSAAVMSRGTLVWAEGFGYADVAAKKAPTADTMYGIGSVSKMLAAATVMRLVDQGKLALDTPVVSYLPSFTMASPDFRKITVRMLLDHSSGMPGTNYSDAFTSPSYYPSQVDEMLQALSIERLKAKPGAWSVYCNDGFTLVERLVPAVTGTSYPTYVAAEIAGPLGMTHTTFPLTDFADGTYAKAYTGDTANPREVCNTLGAGGAYSTPADLCRFGAMLAAGGSYNGANVLSRRAVLEMGTDQTIGQFDPLNGDHFRYGLGWDTVSEEGLKQVGVVGWCKGGDTADYHSALLVAPRQGLVVAVTGIAPLSSSSLEAYAERVMLDALLECGSVKSLASPVVTTAEHAQATPKQLADIEGCWAGTANILRIQRSDSDPQTLDVSVLSSGTWVQLPDPISLRADGYFHGDSSSTRYTTIAGAGIPYLVFDAVSESGTYRCPTLFAQKLVASAPLGSAWAARTGKAWVAVNEQPASTTWSMARGPILTVDAIPGMQGTLAVFTGTYPLQPVRPLNDSLAGMMLKLPGFGATDLEDLIVLRRGDEDWMRFGFTIYRPAESIAGLQTGSTEVAFGPEGYAEWRAVPSGAGLDIVGADAWRLYDADLQSAAAGAQSPAQVTAPTGGGYLLLFGEADSSCEVTVSAAGWAITPAFGPTALTLRGAGAQPVPADLGGLVVHPSLD